MDIIHRNTQIALKRPYTDYSGDFGLPNALREKLLQIGYGESALVWDALIYAGAKAHRAYTLVQIIALLRKAGFQMSEGLVYRGLKTWIFPKDNLIKGVGKPLKRYYLPNLERLLGKLNLGNPLLSDNFRAGDFDSLTLYRRALHRALIERRPGAYSRQFLAQRLGVGKRTTWNYDQAIGIQSEQRFKRWRLHRLLELERALKGAIPGRDWLEVTYWRTGEVKRFPARQFLAEREFMRGGEVTVVSQQTNHYWIEIDQLNATASRLPY